ncbi:hypothetical protein [Ancylomarina longa]|uniref:DUF2812 domain-containing protein n=1 Tax=Ancylomarina longa TaxID=2487017 RepID=A0A434ATQ0_9BACT|nr:hypothetical protein [Ancylomarina longa]RUT77812.1 hypothetical protein DLK05_11485 [Ancylomarina longa]
MQKLIGFNIKRNKKLLVADIIKFFEVRGYELTDANAIGMVFRRGTVLGNFFYLNPIKWNTKVNIEIIKKERMDYDIFATYNFSTLDPFLLREENEYFNAETNAFSKAIQEFDVNVDQVEELALQSSNSNYQYMLKSLPAGVLISILLLFLINTLMKDSLPIWIASIICATTILLTYFLWIKLKNNKSNYPDTKQ